MWEQRQPFKPPPWPYQLPPQKLFMPRTPNSFRPPPPPHSFFQSNTSLMDKVIEKCKKGEREFIQFEFKDVPEGCHIGTLSSSRDSFQLPLLDDIDFDDVIQGKLQDCWVMYLLAHQLQFQYFQKITHTYIYILIV